MGAGFGRWWLGSAAGGTAPPPIVQAPLSTNSQAVTKPAGSSLLPPTGTFVLCVATIAASIAQSIWDGGRWTQAVGVEPASLLSLSSLMSTADGQLIPVWLTLFSYVFPHGGWWHVLPNMAALWVFGAIAEPVMGTRKFVLTYFVSGVVGAFGNALVLPHSQQAIAGASLAISGVVGAYAALRWWCSPHTGAQRLVVMVLEAASVLGVVAWLTLRTVPTAADLTCSVMYHFIPFLLMWLGVRAVSGCKRSRLTDSDPAAKPKAPQKPPPGMAAGSSGGRRPEP